MDEQKKFQELAERVMRLPEGPRKACCWVIANYDTAEEMCREPIAPEAWEAFWQEAKEQEDHFMMALLLLSRAMHENS